MNEVMNRALLSSVKTVGVMVPVDKDGQPVCPVCEARRKKQAEYMRGYRGRKK